ncbi:MAG: hypothetical protein ACR2P2_10075 [Nakamurella sp.]
MSAHPVAVTAQVFLSFVILVTALVQLSNPSRPVYVVGGIVELAIFVAVLGWVAIRVRQRKTRTGTAATDIDDPIAEDFPAVASAVASARDTLSGPVSSLLDRTQVEAAHAGMDAVEHSLRSQLHERDTVRSTLRSLITALGKADADAATDAQARQLRARLQQLSSAIEIKADQLRSESDQIVAVAKPALELQARREAKRQLERARDQAAQVGSEPAQVVGDSPDDGRLDQAVQQVAGRLAGIADVDSINESVLGDKSADVDLAAPGAKRRSADAQRHEKVGDLKPGLSKALQRIAHPGREGLIAWGLLIVAVAGVIAANNRTSWADSRDAATTEAPTTQPPYRPPTLPGLDGTRMRQLAAAAIPHAQVSTDVGQTGGGSSIEFGDQSGQSFVLYYTQTDPSGPVDRVQCMASSRAPFTAVGTSAVLKVCTDLPYRGANPAAITSWINDRIKTLGPQDNYRGVTNGVAVAVGKIQSSQSNPSGSGQFAVYNLTITISTPSS